jgi:hypothetical protein
MEKDSYWGYFCIGVGVLFIWFLVHSNCSGCQGKWARMKKEYGVIENV